MQVLVAGNNGGGKGGLCQTLGTFPYISGIKNVCSGSDVLALCGKKAFDVVFLDAVLNDCSGIEVAELLLGNKNSPKVVFVTALSEYAVEAYRIGAVDYVLKPYSKERIKKTLDRLRSLSLHNKEPADDCINTIGKFAFKDENGNIKILNLDDIIYIEAQGAKSIIKTATCQYKINALLKELEWRLRGKTFFRPHRSYIVNLTQMLEAVRWFNGTYLLKMRAYDDVAIPVTRKNVCAFKDILNL